MTDQEALTLAAQFAGCQADQVKSHRRTGDGGIVIIDPQGRKFTLSGDELEQIQETLAAKERARKPADVVVEKIEDKREDVRDRAEDRRDEREDRRDRREDVREAKEEHPRRRR